MTAIHTTRKFGDNIVRQGNRGERVAALTQYGNAALCSTRRIIRYATCVDNPETSVCEQALGVNPEGEVELHIPDVSAVLPSICPNRPDGRREPSGHFDLHSSFSNNMGLISDSVVHHPSITYTLTRAGLRIERTRVTEARQVPRRAPISELGLDLINAALSTPALSDIDPCRHEARQLETRVIKLVSEGLKSMAIAEGIAYWPDNRGDLRVHRPLRVARDFLNAHLVTRHLITTDISS